MTKDTFNLPFVKMHGAGNDYVFVDGFESDVPAVLGELARRVSNRHTGIGSDGLIVMFPCRENDCDVRMQMWNADGTRGDICGNGIRCVALWMSLTDRTAQKCRIRTDARLVTVNQLDLCRRSGRGSFAAMMGQAQIRDRLQITLSDQTYDCQQVSMGNPHAVIWTDDLSTAHVHSVGPQIAEHQLFPDGTNVEFVRRIDAGTLDVRVWERGAGETQACGSGACAVAAAAVASGHCGTDAPIGVRLPGGTLTIHTSAEGITMSGPAEVSFTGSILLRPLDR